MATKSMKIRRVNGDHPMSTLIHIINLPEEFKGQLKEGVKIEYQIRFQVVEHIDDKKVIEKEGKKELEVSHKKLQLDINKIITDDTLKVPTHNEYHIQKIKNVDLDETLSIQAFLDHIDNAVRSFVYMDFLQNLDSNRRRKVNKDNYTLRRMKELLRRKD